MNSLQLHEMNDCVYRFRESVWYERLDCTTTCKTSWHGGPITAISFVATFAQYYSVEAAMILQVDVPAQHCRVDHRLAQRHSLDHLVMMDHVGVMAVQMVVHLHLSEEDGTGEGTAHTNKV